MSEAPRPAAAAVPQQPDESGARPAAPAPSSRERPDGHVDAQSPTLIASDVAPPTEIERSIVRSSERARLAGRYEILALVGSGGMGTVYRARDIELDEIVALKVMRQELISTPGILERFRREAKLARRVTHRNVARVFDIGEDDHERFLTMEFIEGEPLSAALVREGAFSISRAIRVASSIAEGVGSAHAAGVIHRDLKPDNVLLGADGRVVVTDFGIARAVADVLGGPAARSETLGMFVGTPAYMAPEQVKGSSDIGPRADVYAFGALLYEMLTGARAWPGDAPLAVATARLVDPVPDPRQVAPGLPKDLADLCVRCLAKEPSERPATMTELLAALTAIAVTPEIRDAHPSSLPPRPPVTLGAVALGSAASNARRTISSPGHEMASSDKTVAVLPFRNTGAPEDQYVAEELTDDLIDALSMTQGLRVRARGAVMKYRGSDADPREIGRELAVQVVVEGAVRRANGRVRISARLVSVADGFQVWAKRFDRPEQEVLSVNDEAARAIAQALTLDCGCADARGRAASSNPVVIDLYLRARHEHRSFGVAHQHKALQLFDEALAIAPDDPLLLAGSAMVLARLSFTEGAAILPRARATAERAVSVAPRLPEAHLALGSVAFQANDAMSAIRSLRAAVTAGPGIAEAHAALGRLLGEVGAIDEALRYLDTALLLTPDATGAAMDTVRLLALRGEHARADVALSRLASLDVTAHLMTQTRILLWRDRLDELEAVLARLPESIDARFPRLLAMIAQTRQLPPDLFDLEKEERVGGARRRSFFLQLSAEVQSYCKEPEAALDAIAEAVDAGLIDLPWLLHCPVLEDVRHAPRFAKSLGEVRRRCDAILAVYRS